jgi:hypothetical protein
MDHEAYMEEAIRLAAEAAAAGEVPVGCVIVKDGRIIGRGRNRQEEGNCAIRHAEMEAIAGRFPRALGGWRLAGTALYVTLEPLSPCARGPSSTRGYQSCFTGRGMRSAPAPAEALLNLFVRAVWAQTARRRRNFRGCLCKNFFGSSLPRCAKKP